MEDIILKRLGKIEKYSKILNEYENLFCNFNIEKINDNEFSKLINTLNLIEENPDLFNKFVCYKNLGISYLHDDELLELLELNLNKFPIFIDNEEIKKLIARYLSFPHNKEELLDIIEKNKQNLYGYSNIKKMIKNNPNDSIYSIIVLLRKNSSIDDINKYVGDFVTCTAFDKYFYSNLNLSLLKKLLYEINYKIENSKYNKNKFIKIKGKLFEKIYSLITEKQKDKYLIQEISKGNIVVDATRVNKHCNVTFDKLNLIDQEYILSISDELYSTIDTAFSINEIDGFYNLNIYVSDVPSFLMKNEAVMKSAYEKGTSTYLRLSNNKIYNIDIIPPFLSQKYLSLNKGFIKNVIRFSFAFDKNGELYSSNVDRKKILVNDTISINEVQNIINSDIDLGYNSIIIKNLLEVASIIKDKTQIDDLKNININDANELIKMINMIVNYYVGMTGEYVIYTENGLYTRDMITGNTNSSTPLKKYVSNINLAFFLSQNKIVKYPGNYFQSIQSNIYEIINHLNKQEIISDFSSRHGEFVKKYIKK